MVSVKNKRKLHLDLLRMIAVFLVVYNHTGENAFTFYCDIHNSVWRLPLIAFSHIVRCAVPLFFMISGALLLGKKESIKDLYRKRVLRYSVVLVLASLISFLYQIRFDARQFNLSFFASRLFSYNWCYSYWFLYAYLAWLITLPLLRKLAQNMENKHFRYLLLLEVVISFMKFLPLVLWGEPVSYSNSFSPFVLEYTVFFPLLGYYLEVRVPDTAFCRKNTIFVAALFIVTTVITVVAQNYWLEVFCNWERGHGEGYLSTLRFSPCLFFFYHSKLLYLKHTPRGFWKTIVTIFGDCSFGLYLFQHIYLGVIDDKYFINVFGTYFGTVIWAVAACLLGTTVAYVLKQIPGVKMLL